MLKNDKSTHCIWTSRLSPKSRAENITNTRDKGCSHHSLSDHPNSKNQARALFSFFFFFKGSNNQFDHNFFFFLQFDTFTDRLTWRRLCEWGFSILLTCHFVLSKAASSRRLTANGCTWSHFQTWPWWGSEYQPGTRGGGVPRDGGSSWKKKKLCARVCEVMVVGSFCSKASLPSPLAHQPTRASFLEDMRKKKKRKIPSLHHQLPRDLHKKKKAAPCATLEAHLQSKVRRYQLGPLPLGSTNTHRNTHTPTCTQPCRTKRNC